MNTYKTLIGEREVELPVLDLGNKIRIAFFNLHGNAELTEYCAKLLAEKIKGVDVVLTAESKGLQLAHCVARQLGHAFYAVARKSKKLYMKDGISASVKSITTGEVQTLYLSCHDMNLMKGKKVAVIDDVISTGGSLKGMEELVKAAGGTIENKAAVLVEGDAKLRTDILYLGWIPLL